MILPGFRGVAQGQQGSFLSGTLSEADVPRQPGQALCPHSLLRDPRPGLLELPAGPPERRRGGFPGGGVAQPLRLTVSGWRDPGRSCQARRTIPLSPEKNCASVGRNRDDTHKEWVRLQLPPPRPQFKKIK